MKKKLLLILLATGISTTFAQGNLEFNQVLTVRDVIATVPVGKVWKVESYLQSQVSATGSGALNACTDLNRPRPYTIDGFIYYNMGGIASGSAGYILIAENRFPIWLKDGQQISTTCPSDFLSIIEFNVVP